jgi:hypothetical protein
MIREALLADLPAAYAQPLQPTRSRGIRSKGQAATSACKAVQQGQAAAHLALPRQ